MTKLLLAVAAVAAFSLVQPVKADRIVQNGPTIMSVPDSGSTISMLGPHFARRGDAAAEIALRTVS
jgi:hypothetical protein